MAGNELALQGGAINFKTVSEALTQPLEAALLEATDAKEAARKIAASPALLAEARDRNAVVQRLAGPVTKEDLYKILQPLIILYGLKSFGADAAGQGLQQEWWALYEKVLCKHPREALELAAFEIARTRRYANFPQPAEIEEIAAKEAEEIRLIAFRLRLTVEKADQMKPPPPQTAEDKERVKEIIQQMRGPDGRIVLGKSMDDVVKPSNRAATAEALRRLNDEYQ